MEPSATTAARRLAPSLAFAVSAALTFAVLIGGGFACRAVERSLAADVARRDAASAGHAAKTANATIRATYAAWASLSLAGLATTALIYGRWFGRTRRQRTRRELESLARHFQMVLDSATQVSIIATDMSGVITLFNAGAERMLGYRAADVVGKLTPSVIHDEDEVREHGEALSRQFGRTIEGFGVFVEYARQGSFEEREWTYVRKDGSRLSVSLVVTALTDSSGRMTGFLGIARDVTERLAGEQALREAKETAERANLAKSEFLATMSHEIRTPMNAVIGLTELVLDGELAPVQRDYLETAREAAEGLMTIINEVLDFSKIEAAQLALEHVPFSLRALVGEVVKTLAPRAAYKRVELACRVAPQVPDALRGDPVRLRQILVNLVGNAIKFTERGEVVVEVEGDADAGRTRLRLQVRDTGIGIPADKLDEIFRPFTQADMSTTRRFGGTGLGLAICGKLVRLMGGRLEVESRVGEGSVFRVEVELERAEDDELSERPGDAAPAELAAAPTFVIDSPSTHRRFLVEMLRESGLHVEEFDDVQAARERLRGPRSAGGPPPLLFVARHGANWDGFEFVAALRRDPDLAQAAVAFIGASSRREETRRADELQVAASLAKPIVHADLRRAFAEVLAGRRGEGPTRGRDATAGTMTAAPTRRLRILVGEDVAMNQKLAVGLLVRWGHDVEVAADGREVLRRVAAEPFDLVLMDVSMPELDGLEATREIRRREQGTGRRLPIVAMTAHALASDQAAARAAGMDGYVVKPIRRQELAAVLERLFPEDSSAPRLASPSAIAIDWERVLNELDGDGRLLRDVLDVGLEEAPRLTRRLVEAIAARDAAGAARAAHALKGALRLLDPAGVVGRLETLEEAARRGDFERMESEADAWGAEWPGVRTAVEAYLQVRERSET